jgi:predicted component of type VI protein secretion system
MSYSQNNLRRVQINFDLYIDSDDAAFKLELVLLMISNLEELKEASRKAWANRDMAAYNTSTHKTKSTVTLLDDVELNQAIEDVRIKLAEGTDFSQSNSLTRLHELCDSIRSSLEYEAALLRAQV